MTYKLMDRSTLLFFFFFFIVIGAQASSTLRELLPPEALPTKSGYLPVDPTSSSSSMFYAFYEAQAPTQPLPQTPLLIWLQGGPGCSSMLGNFFELGPWRVNFQRPLSLRPNPGSWNRLFGLLFIDNPVGTGFSVASSPEDIPKDQAQVARHLFTSITRFIKSNPGFGSRPVYITGESYAGKYVPAIGYRIVKRGGGIINLAGVAIGNGLTEPVIQVGTHAASAYFSGLVNERQMRELEAAQSEAIRLTKAGNWSAAVGARSRVLGRLQDMTGLATLYDLRRKEPYEDVLVEELLQDEGVKRALGAKDGIVFEVCSDLVGKVLHEDVMKSAKYMVEYLVRKTRVLLYQGFFDLRDGVVSTESWVKTMDWDGIGGFLEADRKVWKVNGELAGYVQSSGNLTNVVVLGAGHLVPTDQALNSQAMIEDWVLVRGVFGGVEENEEKEKRNYNASKNFRWGNEAINRTSLYES